MIRTTPILADDLPDVGAFLHENLNRRISAQDWVNALSHRWADAIPNHGMQLRDDGRLVGVFCAIYSDQWIDGRLERFCNPHSWCVLNEYRNHSISLILPLLKQRDYHFTMYTPNPKVAEVFRGLKFRDLDDRLLYFPNLPSLRPRAGGAFVEARPDRIAGLLTGSALRDFESHRSIPWLRFVAFGRPDDACLMIYKRDSVKRLPCARIVHLSDREALARHGARVGHHLLLRERLPFSKIEARFTAHVPPFAMQRPRHQPKLVLSRTLDDRQMRDAYSELVALDV